MTAIDKLLLAGGHMNAILYAGATLAFLGFLVGVVTTLVLTAVTRGHGYFPHHVGARGGSGERGSPTGA